MESETGGGLHQIQHRSCDARKAASRPLNEKRPPLRSRRRPIVRVGPEKKRPQRGRGAIGWGRSWSGRVIEPNYSGMLPEIYTT